MFERWCRRNDHVIARILQFDEVEYQSGTFFNRKVEALSPGFQIDLLFIRKDAKIVACECKHVSNTLPSNISAKLLDKIHLFTQVMPKYKSYTLETCLITTLDRDLVKSHRQQFDHIVVLEDLFNHE